jgi:hypothetical protein
MPPCRISRVMPDRYPELTSSIVSLLYDLDYKFADILARITGHLRYHVNCYHTILSRLRRA